MRITNIKNYEYAVKLLKDVENNPIIKPYSDNVLYGLHYNLEDDKLIYASLYTSSKCQLNCIYCSKYYDIKKAAAGQTKVLSKEEILGFIKNSCDFGLKTLIFQGMAEPTDDVNFRDYISYATDLGLNCIVFSNIINLDDDLAEFLFNKNVSIAPSVDSLDEDIYNYLTGSDKYVRFINALNVLKKYYGGKEKLINNKYHRVLLSMVVSDYNVKDLKAIREMCNE